MKLCTKCNRQKEISAFSYDRSKKDGFCCWCRDCKSKCHRIYRELYSEKIKARSRIYYTTHCDKISIKRKNHYNAHIEQKRAKAKELYKLHPERFKRARDKWTKENPNKARCAVRRWTIANSKRIKQNRENWQRANPQKASQYSKKWRLANPEKVVATVEQYRARKMMAPGTGITERQWKKLMKKYSYLCIYCGQKKKLTIDHVIPLSRGGRHDIDNIVPACRPCNSSKQAKPLRVWLLRGSNAEKFLVPGQSNIELSMGARDNV